MIELTLAGWTQEAIAAACGYAEKSGVRYVQQRWVTENGPTHEQTEELRQRMVGQLDKLHSVHWPRGLPRSAT